MRVPSNRTKSRWGNDFTTSIINIVILAAKTDQNAQHSTVLQFDPLLQTNISRRVGLHVE